MITVISVKFKNRGKRYYFDPGALDIRTGMQVIVETSMGMEIGDCVSGCHPVNDELVVNPLRPVIRIATENDLRIAQQNKLRETEARAVCKRQIAALGLEMKLVDVECSFEGSKILFFFTADGRVDFRELVKDLAGVFRTRIEMRQIGVRDEAKMLGGLGICGRPFCCSVYLEEFQPVSTKMAKTQSLSLNPVKISGPCGRLMCCLRNEQKAYEELIKTVPKTGTFVETPAGYGNVTQVNLLRQNVKVRLDGEGDAVIKSYDADEIAVVPGGRPKPGDPMPASVLASRPPKVREEEPEEEALFPMLIDDMAPSVPRRPMPAPESSDGEHRQQRSRRSRNHQGRKPGEQQGAQSGEQPRPQNPPRQQGQKHGGSANRPQTQKKPAPRTEKKPSAEKKGKPAPNRTQTPKPQEQQGQTKANPQTQSGGQNSHRRYRSRKPRSPQAPNKDE